MDSVARRGVARWMQPLEALSAGLMVIIVVLMLGGVTSRYVFGSPIAWIDEAVSIAFLWLAMLGAAIAMQRNEHLRLTLVINRVPERQRGYVQAAGVVAMLALLAALLGPAYHYVVDEWIIRTPALGIPNSVRVAALLFGLCAMLLLVAIHSWRSFRIGQLMVAAIVVAALLLLAWILGPVLRPSQGASLLLLLVGFASVCLLAGVPIAFCFGIGTVAFLAFASSAPLSVVVSRMDEGMSSPILVSVPIFVLLGCLLDATGMGKAIIEFLSSLLGHVKAGMSYVLLGSLFIVSGISGSKVSDMATVAPALFPEMKRRGHRTPEMTALLATGAAMADTVPPSIVLIVLGSVAGVSIAGLFLSGFVVAMVLLLALLVLARWKARHEDTAHARRPSMWKVVRLLLIAGPALALPFVIRGAVGGGVATATEVSTIAVLYAMIIGQVLYGGLSRGTLYSMLKDTASLSGAVLLVLGTAAGMAWAITQSGIVQQLSSFLVTMPGGVIAYMAMTIILFLVLGSLLEGLPA
ncbi:MAG: TRAP transporter large permease subunit, partial [Burkholderiales bacterium]|nr:TRAP transporter large permease subunit [Burkholderiales bacterium]